MARPGGKSHYIKALSSSGISRQPQLSKWQNVSRIYCCGAAVAEWVETVTFALHS